MAVAADRMNAVRASRKSRGLKRLEVWLMPDELDAVKGWGSMSALAPWEAAAEAIREKMKRTG